MSTRTHTMVWGFFWMAFVPIFACHAAYGRRQVNSRISLAPAVDVSNFPSCQQLTLMTQGGTAMPLFCINSPQQHQP
ncbi:hypothetical protein MRX96_043215 [Rhipicephalus microplus]